MAAKKRKDHSDAHVHYWLVVLGHGLAAMQKEIAEMQEVAASALRLQKAQLKKAKRHGKK